MAFAHRDSYEVRAGARKLLLEDATEACFVEGLDAEEWLDEEPTRRLAVSLGLQGELAHVAAVVWSGWREA